MVELFPGRRCLVQRAGKGQVFDVVYLQSLLSHQHKLRIVVCVSHPLCFVYGRLNCLQAVMPRFSISHYSPDNLYRTVKIVIDTASGFSSRSTSLCISPALKDGCLSSATKRPQLRRSGWRCSRRRQGLVCAFTLPPELTTRHAT